MNKALSREQGPYCAYLNLLGTGSHTTSAATQYSERLRLFNTRMIEAAFTLQAAGRVYFFGDAAFIQSPVLRPLITFLMELRRLLFMDGIYFKGAVKIGDLEPQEASDHELLGGDSGSKKLGRVLVGRFFGEETAFLVAMEQALKGIGISLHADVKKELDEKPADRGIPVQSLYVAQSNTRDATVYYDLRIQENELGEASIRRLISNLQMAKTVSRRISRYYISSLVLWLRSINLESDQGKYACDVILSSALQAMLNDVIGIEYVYVALVDRALAEGSPPELRESVARFMRRNRRVLGILEKVPMDFLDLDSRQRITEITTHSFFKLAAQKKQAVSTSAARANRETT